MTPLFIDDPQRTFHLHMSGIDAREYSVDPQQYLDRGGDMGWMKPGIMPPEWDANVFQLSSGQISQPFGVSGLTCIVQMIEPTHFEIAPYGAIAQAVPETAATFLQQQRYLTWLSEQILKERIVIKVAQFAPMVNDALQGLKTHPDQGLGDNGLS